jgi:hypothetical protein
MYDCLYECMYVCVFVGGCVGVCIHAYIIIVSHTKDVYLFEEVFLLFKPN